MLPLIERLRQRKIVQWALAYLAVAWIALQVLGLAADSYGWPDLVMRLAFVAVAVGFGLTLVLAWYHGERGEQKVRGGEVLLLSLVLAAGGGLLWWQASRSPPEPKASTQAAQPNIDPKSIAVLAFANMSADPGNEYFSDGVSEEILNALAKIPGLRIAGRTSSFYFKDRNEPLSTIAATLGVAHILEGSVRKQGERLRITAQLTRTSDGVQLWSQAFDGTDADIFALQEQIARKVAEELKVALELGASGRLVNAGTTNPEAYALYLQASATFNRRDSARYAEAMKQLEQATRLDPGFARAYARLASMYAVALNADTVEFDTALAAAESFAQRASRLDPSLAEPHAALGLTFRYRRMYREGTEAFARALALEPDDVTANFWWAITLTQTGYRRQGIAALDRTLQLDPLLPNALLWRGREHVADGELEQAERLLRRAAEGGHSFFGIGQWQLERARGNREAGMSALAAGLHYFSDAFPAGAPDVFARACFGDVQAKAKALTLIDAHLATKPPYVSGAASYVLIHAGEPARALALSQDRSTTNDGLVMGELFAPPLAEVRRLPEFPEFLRRTGLASYWDEAGSPDQCKKDAQGDYHCE